MKVCAHHICTLGSRIERCNRSQACSHFHKVELRCHRWSCCTLTSSEGEKRSGGKRQFVIFTRHDMNLVSEMYRDFVDTG